METTRTLIINSFSPPLGEGSLPSAMDIRYFIAALSIYALLSIPTALILFGVEKTFSWLKGKIKVSFLDLNRMDLYLLFGWGLLFFKWISNLNPYLAYTFHPNLTKVSYLLILPLLGIQLWLGSFVKKNTIYYRSQWIIIFIGTIFLSKTAYDIFISSSLSVFMRVCLFMLFAPGTLFIALFFHSLLNRMLLNRVKLRPSYTILFTFCLSGGCLFTLNAFHIPNHYITSLQQPIKSQKVESEIKNNGNYSGTSFQQDEKYCPPV